VRQATQRAREARAEIKALRSGTIDQDDLRAALEEFNGIWGQLTRQEQAREVQGRRLLAKNFFFWAVNGLRRQYGEVDLVFIAHTNQAWEFTEEEFFSATATGGTVASTAFKLAHEILTNRFSPERYNSYIFYASDGDNFGDDRQQAHDCVAELAGMVNFMGFLETPQNFLENGRSEIGRLFRSLASRDFPVGSYTVHKSEDIWEAIRLFFQHEAEQAA